ncbi:MAG: hypothetical protein AVDCRST_MAG67-3955 [uncultured Solirubrobacteraceae bacterium]|uniref:Uncharacterized protein n=1 Tax=uncultured Solirubrobacteraceae bacterium TaxID=1162706 RepID=A0A6J4TRD9_9ACTN|nr:MAG: hypothetical protein AVDCRST_MAG67-3955 [uncultured Solirubrobacteraceae bacterium]
MTTGHTPYHEEPAEAVDARPGTDVRPLANRPSAQAAPAASARSAPSQEPQQRYWLSRTWEHDGLLNPRGWVEPTKFLLQDEGGRVVYRMVALSAWSERRMAIHDRDGLPLAVLHKTWRRGSFELLRGGLVEAAITYKDPVWRWRDRYVVQAADGTKIVVLPTSVGSRVYEFREDGRTLARYTQRGWLEIGEGVDLVLATATVLSIVLGPWFGSLGD